MDQGPLVQREGRGQILPKRSELFLDLLLLIPGTLECVFFKICIQIKGLT